MGREHHTPLVRLAALEIPETWTIIEKARFLTGLAAIRVEAS